MQNGKTEFGRGARWRSLLVAAVATVATMWSSAAMATITQGDFSIFGFFETRESGRWGEGSTHDNGTATTYKTVSPSIIAIDHAGTYGGQGGGSFDFSHWDLVQARQIADIRPDYHMVKNYKLLGRFDTLILKDADFFAFYRPWYDAEGTLKNKGVAETNRDWGNYDHNTLQQQYFRNDLHEYYAQMNFTDNLSVRAGKQQVIWSEADAFSGTDVTNTIDSTYHWVHFESPEQQRKNLRMIKMNYILPDYLKTANNELEAFIIPGDFQGDGFAANVDDARNPWACSACAIGPAAGYNQNGQAYKDQTYAQNGAKPLAIFGTVGFADKIVRNISGRPSNAWENSEFGIRLSSLLPVGNGLQTSFAYLYEARQDRLGLCTECNAHQAGMSTGSAGGWTRAVPGVFFKGGYFNGHTPRPGVPVFGSELIMLSGDHLRHSYFILTGTYYDKALTDVVYRYDFEYVPKIGAVSSTYGPSLSGWTEFSRFVIAGDRPTYIPLISKQHTFFVAQNTVTWYPDRVAGTVPNLGNFAGKQREISDFFFLSAVDWVMNGQVTTTNTVELDIDNNTQALASNNVFRYSRNILFGANAIWYMGRSARYTDPYALSRGQRINELEFTFTYEI